MRRDTPNGTKFGMGKGETNILPEAIGVDVGERKRPVREIGKDGTHCKCGWKVKSTDRICPNCGVLLSRGGEILPIREIKRPPTTGKLTEVFVPSGAFEIRQPVSRSSEVEPDPAGRHDADAARAALGGLDSDFEYGETKDPAGVIDVRGLDWVPGKGYVKKKDEK